MFEAKVILLERSISDLVIKLDTFMCMENSDDDSIDTATDVNEEVIDTEPLKQEEKFPCHLCDFVSNKPYGLVIHKGRKHKNGASSLVIGQFDGKSTVNEEIASMAEPDGIDVDKSANVVETPEDLLNNSRSPIAQFDGNVTMNEEVATMTEADGVDVVKSDNVVETPRNLSSVCHLGIWTATVHKPEDVGKKIWIGPRKK